MKTTTAPAKFKLNKTIVVRFSKPGTANSYGSTSILDTVTSIIGPDFGV